jgi:hypothetical protein
MMRGDIQEASGLLAALLKIESEREQISQISGRMVGTDVILLPPGMWVEIMDVAKGLVLKRLAELGVEVEL